MKNLLEQLCVAGLPDEVAKKSMQVVFSWVEEHYPVMAMVAKATIMKELEESWLNRKAIS